MELINLSCVKANAHCLGMSADLETTSKSGVRCDRSSSSKKNGGAIAPTLTVFKNAT
ncbi:MAG: hypothetical protein V7K18_19895 [Nostoc sp.]|uniref:hypothetical protein n=1 Tax=Nostoc sp. TaxID=1180 RepID=UPI002FF9CF89